MSNQNAIVTYFNGKKIPSLDEVVYIVKRATHRDQRGRLIKSRQPTSVVLVEGTVSQISYGSNLHLVGRYGTQPILKFAPSWSGLACVNECRSDDRMAVEQAFIGPYNASADKAEAESFLEFYRKHGIYEGDELLRSLLFREGEGGCMEAVDLYNSSGARC